MGCLERVSSSWNIWGRTRATGTTNHGPGFKSAFFNSTAYLHKGFAYIVDFKGEEGVRHLGDLLRPQSDSKHGL